MTRESGTTYQFRTSQKINLDQSTFKLQQCKYCLDWLWKLVLLQSLMQKQVSRRANQNQKRTNNPNLIIQINWRRKICRSSRSCWNKVQKFRLSNKHHRNYFTRTLLDPKFLISKVNSWASKNDSEKRFQDKIQNDQDHRQCWESSRLETCWSSRLSIDSNDRLRIWHRVRRLSLSFRWTHWF